MANKTSEVFSQLPPWAKGVLAMAGIVAIGAVGYVIYKEIKKREADKGNKAENTAANSELADLLRRGIKPSYQKSQYASYANSLWEAMDGYGTDSDLIMRIIANMKNDADFLALSSAYGIRTVSSGAGNPEPDLKGTLSAALASELSNSKIKDINASMAKKGITYKF